jgi:hypothetical protein
VTTLTVHLRKSLQRQGHINHGRRYTRADEKVKAIDWHLIASGLLAPVNAAGFQEGRMCGDARSGFTTLRLLSAFLKLASWHLLRWLWPL